MNKEIIGYLSGKSEITGTLSETSKLTGTLSIPDKLGDPYQGPYEVVPSGGFQFLFTSETYMEEDVLIHPIPYSEVSNPSGGYTATIGG